LLLRVRPPSLAGVWAFAGRYRDDLPGVRDVAWDQRCGAAARGSCLLGDQFRGADGHGGELPFAPFEVVCPSVDVGARVEAKQLACKSDKIDARGLAVLPERDLVPQIWLPDPGVRSLLEQARFRMHLDG
jgi:hypothetical protein